MRALRWPIRLTTTCVRRCSRSIGSVVVVATVVAALSFTTSGLAASAATVAFPTDSSAVQSGDTVNLVVTLTTTDPNEDGEGEPALITSTGGFSATVSAYNEPQSLSPYVATTDGETFSAVIPNSDGDESVSLQISTCGGPTQAGIASLTAGPLADGPSCPAKRFGAKTRPLYSQLASDLESAGDITAMAALGCLEIPIPPVQVTCLEVYGLAAGVAFLLHVKYADLGKDPTDPNFMVIAQPVYPAVPPTPPGLPQTKRDVDAFNALMQSEEQSIGLTNAMQIAVNRAQGADDAGNAFWVSKQTTALYEYAARLADVLDGQPGLLMNLVNALGDGAFPPSTFSPADVLSFEGSVAAGGLPDHVTQALTELGATPAEISQIRTVAFVQDINAVAGSLPAKFADRALLSDLHSLASSLRDDVAAHLGPPVSCLAPTTHLVSGIVHGSLTINGAGSWCVRGARVEGSVRIAGGANVLIANSTVAGAIVARAAGVFALCGSSVSGAVLVSQANGFVLIGDPSDDLCDGNHVNGAVDLMGNQGGAEVSENTLYGALVVNGTSGNGADHGGYPEDLGSEIEGNTVHGLLVCAANTPQPSDDGDRNQAPIRIGQCGARGF
jgi:hypothetical protein